MPFVVKCSTKLIFFCSDGAKWHQRVTVAIMGAVRTTGDTYPLPQKPDIP